MESKEIIRMSSPLIVMGSVWLAKKAFATGFRIAFGEDAPSADDLDAPLGRVLLVSIGAASVAAVVHVGVNRGLARALGPDPQPVV